MDAGIIGGIIGVGMLAALGLCIKLRDIYERWMKSRETPNGTLSQTSPLLVLQRQHSKINMVLPK
jgi:hypothetical protein